MILDRRKTLLVAGATLAMPGLIRNRPAFAAAPMLGPARPQFYRFQLGDFEVTTLRDGAVQVDGPHPIFGEDQPAEDVAAFAEENFLPADRMEISFTPVLVNTGEALVLFDSGNVADRRPGAGQPRGRHRGRWLHRRPGRRRRDHPHARRPYRRADDRRRAHLPERRLCHGRDRVRLLEPRRPAERPDRRRGPAGAQQRRATGRDNALHRRRGRGGAGHQRHRRLRPHAGAHGLPHRKRRLPAHALGGRANHYVLSVQQPDWHVRFDMDKEAAVATRRRLFDMANAERIPVTGYHMPFPAVGFVDTTADGGYRWVQASYQLHL
jgi:hypothetical protein